MSWPSKWRALLAPVLIIAGFSPNSTESAVANGDTRTISLMSPHTQESGTFAFKVNGVYDSAVLEKLNWMMRDWRHDEPTKMDPHLFDIVWEVYRESGSSMPIEVLSGYRSPETNAMLRRRSRQVAEHSQHMLGKAMDAHFQDVPVSKVRDIAMRLQAGGIGFYPTSGTPWVHLDSGSVRYWPRMSHDAIARLFPDGKTVFVPSDGVPMPGFDQARAEIEARGGAIGDSYSGGKSFFALLFGGGADDAEEGTGAFAGGQTLASASPSGRSGGANQVFFAQSRIAVEPDPVSRAQRNLPKGETYMKPAETQVASATPSDVGLLGAGRAAKPIFGMAEAPASASPQPQRVAAPAIAPLVAAPPEVATLAAPIPPRRPAEFLVADLGLAHNVPAPPPRPIEFASLQADAPPAAVTAAIKGPDAIAALLALKAPGGAGERAPTQALAMLEINFAPSGERVAALARASALSAPLPPLPVPRPPDFKAPLVAAHIDKSNYSVMTAAPKPVERVAPPRVVLIQPTQNAAMLRAALSPSAETAGRFETSQPYGDLRADAFTGPAVKPLERVADGAPALRGD